MNFLIPVKLPFEYYKYDNPLLLGEWCRNDIGLSKNFDTVKFAWDSCEKIFDASLYCRKAFDCFLPLVAKKLNDYHGVDFSAGYYNALLGNWLAGFIEQAYDKYTSIKYVSENYEFTSVMLDKKQFYTPLDTLDCVVSYANNHAYNFQIYSQIFELLGFEFDRIEIEDHIESTTFFKSNISMNFPNRAIRYLFLVLSQISKFLYKSKITTITEGYFGKNSLQKRLQLYIKSKGRIVFDDFDRDFNFYISYDTAFRNSRLANDNTNSEFFVVLSGLILQHLPVAFLECFSRLREIAITSTFVSKFYYTANALHYNMLFKLFVAEKKDQIIVASHQHGGGYGTHYFNLHEYYENSVSDIFYTWGWQECSAQKYLPAAKLAKSAKLNDAVGTKVAYVLNSYPQHLYRFQCGYTSSITPLYILPKMQSFLTLLDSYGVDLTIRPPLSYIWNEKKIISEMRLRNVEVDESQIDFEIFLPSCKLVIFDDLQTTYLESLSRNIPTIIYVDRRFHKIRTSAIAYFDLLYESNILFYDHASAANHIKSIISDVDSWWQSATVQKARTLFCEKYAKTSNDWVKDWVKEFNNIIMESENVKK